MLSQRFNLNVDEGLRSDLDDRSNEANPHPWHDVPAAPNTYKRTRNHSGLELMFNLLQSYAGCPADGLVHLLLAHTTLLVRFFGSVRNKYPITHPFPSSYILPPMLWLF